MSHFGIEHNQFSVHHCRPGLPSSSIVGQPRYTGKRSIFDSSVSFWPREFILGLALIRRCLQALVGRGLRSCSSNFSFQGYHDHRKKAKAAKRRDAAFSPTNVAVPVEAVVEAPAGLLVDVLEPETEPVDDPDVPEPAPALGVGPAVELFVFTSVPLLVELL